jgi:hypothetical protein
MAIARAEGSTMPTGQPVMAVARLDPPRPDQIRSNPARSEARPSAIAAGSFPVLPPVPAAGHVAPARPMPSQPVVAAAAAPAPVRPRAEAQPTIPAEILQAVRPPSRPVEARVAAPQPTPRAPAAVPHPDDSLPVGWYVPQPPRQRSYAPAIATAAEPIFARLAGSATGGPTLDLGLYSDAARVAELRRAFAGLGDLTVTPVAPGGAVVALVLAARDDGAAVSALSLARDLRTERAVLLAGPRGL